MANYMAEVAKTLGVELGEEFEIREQPDIKCKIYNGGLHVYPIKDGIYYISSPECTLYRLLAGVITIKRKPWKPQYDESYYHVGTQGCVHCERWYNDALDVLYYKLGNCYRTNKEAEVNRDKWIAFYASDDVLKV